jgi:hypothetical protein
LSNLACPSVAILWIENGADGSSANSGTISSHVNIPSEMHHNLRAVPQTAI